MAKKESINMIETFAEFKELKNIDRSTMISVLEESFRNVLSKMFGTDENFSVIINPDKGDCEIWRTRVVVEDGKVKKPNKQISLSEAKKIDEDYFLEYTNYAGNFYGTPKEHIKKHLEKGIDVILEIEIEGATNIKKLIPEALFIFIMPPSLKTLVKRLKGRGTESNDKIIKRFHEAYKEINEVTKYNYVVVNDEIQDTVNTIEAIIKAEKCRVDRIEEVYLDTKEEEIHELLMQEDFDNAGLAEKID